MSDRRRAPSVETPAEGANDKTSQVKNSLVVARWMIVSRVTGFLRLAAVAAILGPTFFGNLVQAALFLPVIAYEVLSGSLCGPLLVPAVVRHVDDDDPRAQERVAGGFLGIVLVALGGLVALMTLAGPLVVRLLTLGVADDVTRSDLLELGWPLLALTLPQAVLFAVAEIGAAVQNAHGVFGRPAAAPAIGNIGVAAVILASGPLFGTGLTADQVDSGLILFLGVGTTIAVGVQAATQLLGARLCGVRLRPRWGWSDPEVREIVSVAWAAAAQGAIQALRFFAMLVAAGTVAGGVVAFQMALTFVFFAAALGGDAIAISSLPDLSRLHLRDERSELLREWRRVVRLSLFLLAPMAAFFLAAAYPIGELVAFGEMNTETGITLIATSLLALAPAAIGHGGFRLATQASYAQRDGASPLKAMVVRAAITLAVVIVVTAAIDGRAALAVTGLGVSLADLVGFALLGWMFESTFGPTGTSRPHGLELARTLPAAGAAWIATAALAVVLEDQFQHRAVAVGLLCLLGLVTIGVYLVVQRALRSAALDDLTSGLLGGRRPAEVSA